MPKPFTNWAVPPIPYSVSPFLSITPLCFGSSVHLHRFAEETICAGAKTHVLNYQYVFLEINVSTVLSLCVFTGKGQTSPFIQAPWFHFVNYTFLCIVLRVCRSSTVILDFWCFHGWKFPCSMSAGPLLVCGNVICFVLHSAAFKAVSYIWSWMLLVFRTGLLKSSTADTFHDYIQHGGCLTIIMLIFLSSCSIFYCYIFISP